jgi:hypothetical protein
MNELLSQNSATSNHSKEKGKPLQALLEEDGDPLIEEPAMV